MKLYVQYYDLNQYERDNENVHCFKFIFINYLNPIYQNICVRSEQITKLKKIWMVTSDQELTKLFLRDFLMQIFMI